MSGRHAWAALLAALVAAGPAGAENRAVVIGNRGYDTLPDAAGSSPAAAAAAFRAAGFRVVEGSDLGIADLRRALADLLRPDPSPGRRVVVLMGRFAHSGSESWFLGREAGTETLVSADAAGVPLARVAELMAGGAGSVLLLGTGTETFPTGAGLAPGIGGTAAGGVAVIAGHPAVIGRAAERLAQGGQADALLTAEPGLRRVTATPPGGRPVVVTTPGNQPVVVPPPGAQPVPPPVVQPAPVTPSRLEDIARPEEEEMAAWTRAKRAGSAAGYREFLEKYPSSIFAGAARGRMAELSAEAAAPRSDPAVAAEAALNLDRAQRAQIQRQLTLLAYDTRGIDGTFGPDTRAAIRAFQRNGGVAATGYLSAGQVDLIARSAALREKGFEEAARRRQAEQDRADSALWAEVRGQGEAGARRYLARFPDGRNADAARNVLADAARRDVVRMQDVPARAADDGAWARAEAGNSIAGYRTYLERFPRGRHADAARRQIETRQAQQQADARAEAALDLSPPVLMAVQARLAALGLEPGAADGRFRPETRSALRRYQSARNLRPSGYLNQATLVRLLADTLVRD